MKKRPQGTTFSENWLNITPTYQCTMPWKRNYKSKGRSEGEAQGGAVPNAERKKLSRAFWRRRCMHLGREGELHGHGRDLRLLVCVCLSVRRFCCRSRTFRPGDREGAGVPDARPGRASLLPSVVSASPAQRRAPEEHFAVLRIRHGVPVHGHQWRRAGARSCSF